MAKQNVTFGERHLEKLVIGVAGAVLLATVFLYVVQDPYSVDLSGTTLSPGAFYGKLDGEVVQVVQRLRNAPAPEFKPWEAPKPPVNKNAELATVYVTINPPVPTAEAGIELGVKLDLVAILPPTKPVTTTGRGMATPPASVFKILDQPEPPVTLEPAQPQEFHWVAVFAAVNRRAQQDAFFQAKYATDRQLLVVTRVEAERQRLLPDGTWEEPAQPVDFQYAAMAYGGRPTVELTNDNGAPGIDPEDYKYILDLTSQAAKDQALILRPDFQKALESENPGEWKVPEELPDGLKIDWVNDYGLIVAAPKVAEKSGPLDAATRVDYKKIKAQAIEAQGKGQHAEAVRLLSDAISSNKLLAKDLEDAQALLKTVEAGAEKALADLAKARAAREATVTANLGAEIDPLWVTDTTAKPGATYRYRLRVLAVNPHAGLIAKLRTPEDAAKIILAGEWSEWTDPVSLPPSQHLFFVASDAPNQSARVELYSWSTGEWKKSSGTLNVGQAVQFTERYQQYSYDAVVAAIEPAREYEERIVDAKKGIRYREPKSGDAVALLRADGEVIEHLVPRDMDVRRELNPELIKKRESLDNANLIRPTQTGGRTGRGRDGEDGDPRVRGARP